MEEQEDEVRLTEAYARHDGLMQSLLAMNGGNPNLYAAMGCNEGYDSLLCSLRAEQAVIEELSCSANAEKGGDGSPEKR